MQLNTRQARIFKLANLLGTGKPVSAADIITSLECSEPTLTRALKELRESCLRRSNTARQVIPTISLIRASWIKRPLRRMNEALAQNAELKTGESTGKVVLDKDKKTAVSLSLRMRILRKIDRLAALSGSSRSEAVEKLALHSIFDELIKEYSAKKS